MDTETKKITVLMDLIQMQGYDLNPVTIGELKALQSDTEDKNAIDTLMVITKHFEAKKKSVSFDEDIKPGY